MSTRNGKRRCGLEPGRNSSQLAIAMLANDQRAADNLFRRFAQLDVEDAAFERHALAEVCIALSVHAMIDDDLFFPELPAAAS